VESDQKIDELNYTQATYKIKQQHMGEIKHRKADTLAEHFKTSFANDLDNDNTKLPTQITNLNCAIEAITKAEIKFQIRQIKNKKAPGYDLIGGKILKELPDATITDIRNLFNGILRLQYFPIILLHIIISNTARSYRPISLLPVLSKVFQKALFNRIEPTLEQKKYNTFSPIRLLEH